MSDDKVLATVEVTKMSLEVEKSGNVTVRANGIQDERATLLHGDFLEVERRKTNWIITQRKPRVIPTRDAITDELILALGAEETADEIANRVLKLFGAA